MKRAERQRQERALEEKQRGAAVRLARYALLDHRIPDSGHLVDDMKHPLFLNELGARESGPTGVTYATDVVRRYLRVIAERTGGGAQVAGEHVAQLLGQERAARLGVNLRKLKVFDRPSADGGRTVEIQISDHDVIAIAGYLVLPEGLNFGNLPPNPFGSPRMVDLMERIKQLDYAARRAPEHQFTRSGGATADKLRDSANRYVDIALHEMSRVLPSNEAREAALQAMHLETYVELFTPGRGSHVGDRDIQAVAADPVTGRPAQGPRRVSVYQTVRVAPGDGPTRYRARSGGDAIASVLVSLYER